MYVSLDSCVLSGRGLCGGPILHPEEFYRMWCVCLRSQNLNSEAGEVRVGLLRHGAIFSVLVFQPGRFISSLYKGGK